MLSCVLYSRKGATEVVSCVPLPGSEGSCGVMQPGLGRVEVISHLPRMVRGLLRQVPAPNNTNMLLHPTMLLYQILVQCTLWKMSSQTKNFNYCLLVLKLYIQYRQPQIFTKKEDNGNIKKSFKLNQDLEQQNLFKAYWTHSLFQLSKWQLKSYK